MDKTKLFNSILDLIKKNSTTLPLDVYDSIEYLASQATDGTSKFAFDLIKENIAISLKEKRPLCQDTGLLTFYVSHPKGFDQVMFRKIAEESTIKATEGGYLRQNSVDSITGKNSGNNLGKGSPQFYFEESSDNSFEVRLIQKGGGCENSSAQYALPTRIEGKLFGRDLNGVKAVVIDAINKAQGLGCAPGFIGVCIGGDRSGGYSSAKKALLKNVGTPNSNPELAQLEKDIISSCNSLDIGVMGFGDSGTLGSCSITDLNRLPASYFVTIAYMCWAYRRQGITLDINGSIEKWLYPIAEVKNLSAKKEPNYIKLSLPAEESDIRKLKCGDSVMLSGVICTGRDSVHKYLHEGGELDVIKDGIVYHCGPVVTNKDGIYKVEAAGPTTSIREEPYQAEVIKKFGLKGVIGKGGMGDSTLKACQENGAVYFHAIGGAAQVYAKSVKMVKEVFLEEFGSPEAVWVLEVEDFPVIVTMDSMGNSLHKDVLEKSTKKLKDLLS